MYYMPYVYPYPYPYYSQVPMYDERQLVYWNEPYMLEDVLGARVLFKDYGPGPLVVNINSAAKQNKNYRTTIWTGPHMQVTLMSIPVGEDIGLEVHPDNDQFLRIEQGKGLVQMGRRKDHLTYREAATDDTAIMVPAGTWHNVTNTGTTPLKLYSIYAPAHHPFGTVQKTKAEALASGE